MITESKLRKALLAGETMFLIAGIRSPVTANQTITDGKIEFTGVDSRGKTKSARLTIALPGIAAGEFI